MSEIIQKPKIKLSLKTFGPGLLMASAAIGGSHLIASTKAGAMFGWQLVAIILLVNFLKYPFFRYSVDYTHDNGHSLVEGYARKSRVYLTVFFFLCVISAAVNTGAVGMLSAVILKQLVPSLSGISNPILALILLGIAWLITIVGHYKLLDKVTKIIVISLAVATVFAVIIATGNMPEVAPDFVQVSPWSLGSLAFLIALMGWMPAPIEISAINSMWITAKKEEEFVSKEAALLDFNVGYIGTALLAIVFLALGSLVLHGTQTEIAASAFAYVPQLIQLYSITIGDWSTSLVAFIAFACIYGTTITIVDGYARVIGESARLFTNKPKLSTAILNTSITFVVAAALLIIFAFTSHLKDMLSFAMILAFLSAPVFAWLNFSLVRKEGNISDLLQGISWIGLAFLSIFTLVFILFKAGFFN